MSYRFLFIMSNIHKKLTSHVKKELNKEGVVLSPGQMGIILALKKNSKTTMGALGNIVNIDNAALSRLVEKLEKEELVVRSINPDDRRQMLVDITDKGLFRAEIVKKIANRANDMIKEGFSDEEIEVYSRVNLSILEKF